MNEAAVQQRAQLEHCRNVPGGQMWRNNSGACEDKTGRLIRYGLGHTSSEQVRAWASSDLIGITPTLIKPEMVGYWLGVFTAYEVKPPQWHLTPGDQRGQAQDKFHQIVRQSCGYAGFVTDPSDIYGIIRL